MLIKWNKIEQSGGVVLHSSPDVDGYDIYEEAGDKFYVRSIGTDWQPIGPMDNFKAAEDIVMKIGITLAQYEEALWKVMAAQALKANPTMFDGTASQVEETAP